MKKQLQGSIALLCATVIWGSAFVAQSVGMDKVGPFTFQAVRCFLAVFALLPFIFLRDRKGFTRRMMDPKLWKAGILCGSALFVAANLQQTGLIYTTAGKGGFITAMYIVLVPILGLFLKIKPPKSTIFSVILAVIGLYLLSCAGTAEISAGDVLMLGCALAFAVQITLIDHLAGNFDGMTLNCVQSFVCAVLSAVFMVFTETPDVGDIFSCWLPIVYAGVLSMGLAYTLQIVGQKNLEPTAASLIMSLESVFAALFGWLILHESMTPWELGGCGLVFAAVILSQLPNQKK